MNVTSLPSTEPEEIDGPVQESTALLTEGLTIDSNGNTVQSAEVTFRPGERTKLHTHNGTQVLYVTEGTGIVATREGRRFVTQGDIVVFPSGEEHWHGSSPDAESPFSHVYVLVADEETETTVIE